MFPELLINREKFTVLTSAVMLFFGIIHLTFLLTYTIVCFLTGNNDGCIANRDARLTISILVPISLSLLSLFLILRMLFKPPRLCELLRVSIAMLLPVATFVYWDDAVSKIKCVEIEEGSNDRVIGSILHYMSYAISALCLVPIRCEKKKKSVAYRRVERSHSLE